MNTFHHKVATSNPISNPQQKRTFVLLLQIEVIQRPSDAEKSPQNEPGKALRQRQKDPRCHCVSSSEDRFRGRLASTHHWTAGDRTQNEQERPFCPFPIERSAGARDG